MYRETEVGYLHFMEGRLIDAEVGDLVGEPAAFEIVGWSSTDIEIKTFGGQRQARIDCSLTMLLLEKQPAQRRAEPTA